MHRTDLRAEVRQAVADTSASSLWTDAEVNSAIARAIRTYGLYVPLLATATVSVGVGLASVTLPAAVHAATIAAVRDPAGNEIGPAGDHSGAGAEAYSRYLQAWRVWDGELLLRRATTSAEVGDWAIDYRGGRTAINDDVTAQPIEPGDEGIVVNLTSASLISSRHADDAKRNLRVGSWPDFQALAMGEIRRRTRRPVGSWLAL